MTDIAKSITGFRKRCGYTQKELAARLGVSIQTVSKWEKGISSPDINLLPTLADTFGVSIDRLFGRDYETLCQTIDESYDELSDLMLRRVRFVQSRYWYPESEEERMTLVESCRQILYDDPHAEVGYGLPYTKMFYYSPDTGFAGVDDVGKTMFTDGVDEFFEFTGKKVNRRVIDLLRVNGRRRHISVEFIAEKLGENKDDVQECMNFLMKYGIMAEFDVPLDGERTVKIYKWIEPGMGTRQFALLRIVAAFSKKFMTKPTKLAAWVG